MTNESEAQKQSEEAANGPRVGTIGRRRLIRTVGGVAVAGLSVPLLSGSATAHFPESLSIDVRPWRDSNRISRARGVVPVAVHYVEFEDHHGEQVVFDPTERPERYRFGAPAAIETGDGARPLPHSFEHDLTGDGHDDLVLLFRLREAGFDGDEERATLVWERDESGDHGYSGTDHIDCCSGRRRGDWR
ncbi:hypothetical protein [Haloarchaeobius sp. DFWS5]|uniref:hypothetical protein n=1 Tax=Haloarchaeobius sp. DFWS5 TaxID=3446114 RepID=UPI003EB7F533